MNNPAILKVQKQILKLVAEKYPEVYLVAEQR